MMAKKQELEEGKIIIMMTDDWLIACLIRLLFMLCMCML
jgi:hypothetical protein